MAGGELDFDAFAGIENVSKNLHDFPRVARLS